MVQNGPTYSKMVQNGQWSKIVQNVQNGPTCSKMFQNGQWSKIVQNAPNCNFCTFYIRVCVRSRVLLLGIPTDLRATVIFGFDGKQAVSTVLPSVVRRDSKSLFVLPWLLSLGGRQFNKFSEFLAGVPIQTGSGHVLSFSTSPYRSKCLTAPCLPKPRL